MSQDREDNFTFACPECGEELEVNEGMRTALLNNGCVICGATLNEEAFSQASSAC